MASYLHARARLTLAAFFILVVTMVPAHAAVTITFWSQELGTNFPHAFFTLKGVPDAGGEPVDASYGFTAKAVTPAVLFGDVPGRIDIATHDYIAKSDAQFSLELTDDQYRSIMSLVDEWGENGDHHYNLNRRNCVHFVAEAARRAGLVVTEPKALMKKPRSFLVAVDAANRDRVVTIGLPAREYWAKLEAGSAPGAAAAAATAAGVAGTSSLSPPR